jgi:hypothetical protein
MQDSGVEAVQQVILAQNANPLGDTVTVMSTLLRQPRWSSFFVRLSAYVSAPLTEGTDQTTSTYTLDVPPLWAPSPRYPCPPSTRLCPNLTFPFLLSTCGCYPASPCHRGTLGIWVKFDARGAFNFELVPGQGWFLSLPRPDIQWRRLCNQLQ